MFRDGVLYWRSQANFWIDWPLNNRCVCHWWTDPMFGVNAPFLLAVKGITNFISLWTWPQLPNREFIAFLPRIYPRVRPGRFWLHAINENQQAVSLMACDKPNLACYGKQRYFYGSAIASTSDPKVISTYNFSCLWPLLWPGARMLRHSRMEVEWRVSDTVNGHRDLPQHNNKDKREMTLYFFSYCRMRSENVCPVVIVDFPSDNE
jgi:hypothetical protein